MRIFVSGSIARDLIMDFPGRFRDFVDPKKIHILNLSFAVDNLRENIGGTGANISYNLALLGERPNLIGNIGRDQISLLERFNKSGIDTLNIKLSEMRTAAAYIITDRDDNQITGFHAGAMNEARQGRPHVKRGDLAIIAPELTKNMVNLARFYIKKGIEYIFDPGQQITALSKSESQMGIKGARVLIGNDYEIGLLGKFVQIAKRRGSTVVKTMGPKGSEIYSKGRRIKIGIAKPKRVLDPTGAGDAYRAGFLKGLVLGYNLEVCGELGATVASFAIEEYGTQNHKFTKKNVEKRYSKNFNKRVSLS